MSGVGIVAFALFMFANSCVEVQADLIHKRPTNGKGSIMMSHDSSHEHYNNETLMVTFDLECLNGDSQIQGLKLNSIISHFDGCLKQHSTKQHFQHNGFGISFLNFEKNENNNNLGYGLECLNNDKNGNNFDYNQHCVYMFSYEPIFYLHNKYGEYSHIGNNTVFNDSTEYHCVNQHTDNSSLPSGYAWGLANIDSKINDNLFTFPYIDLTSNDNDNGVDLYIVDSGIRETHNEFGNGQVIHELGDGYASYPSLGYVGSHGTHVAGTAGGRNYGVSKNLTIYDYRVCIYNEYSTPSSESDMPCYYNLILTALNMIQDKLSSNQRRGVINLSLGGSRSYFSYLFEYYFDKIVEYGGIVTVAAGNSGDDACNYSPAFTSSAITVGAVSSSLEMTSFSNWGDCVDVWAPGQDVYSSIANSDTSYESYAGTSMASPHMCGFIANVLLINPSLSYNEIKYILKESKHDNNSYIHIKNSYCDPGYNGYECIFPLYSCNTLPTDYIGYQYVVETPSTTDFMFVENNDSAVYDGFIDYECNTVGVAVIDDDTIDSSNVNDIAVSEVAYEPTDVCSTMKTNDEIYISWSYVCIDTDIAAFVIWDGETCDTQLYDITVLKYIYDGMIDNGYWYHIDCENEFENYENLTDYKASTSNDNDCVVRYRTWFAKDFVLIPEIIPISLSMNNYYNVDSSSSAADAQEDAQDGRDTSTAASTNSDDNNDNNQMNTLLEYGGMNGIISILSNDSYSGNYECNGFNTSEDTYIDYSFSIGTCHWIYDGFISYEISCDGDTGTIEWNYYLSSDCSGTIFTTSTLYQGCYDTSGYYLELIECGTDSYGEIPTTYDYEFVWYVGDNGKFSTEETIGCMGDGCSVTAKWEINNQCAAPRIAFWVLENDYSSVSEEALIYINGDYIGSCEPLDNDAVYNFTKCEFDDDISWINEYIDAELKHSSQDLVVTIDTTEDVNCCDYNGYQLLAIVQVYCGIYGNYTTSAPTPIPTMIPTMPSQLPSQVPTFNPTYWDAGVPDYYFNVGMNGIYSDTREFGCVGAGCMVSKVWQINGTCSNPQLYVSIVETDFSYYSENLYILVNNNKWKSCEPLDEDCSYDWVECEGDTSISESINESGNGINNTQYLGVAFNASEEVNVCQYYKDGMSYQVWGSVTIECGNNDSFTDYSTTEWYSHMPTSAPTTPAPDYYFHVGLNDEYENVQEFGCMAAGCNVFKVWQIYDQCMYPHLYVQTVETDFASSTETLDIWINGNQWKSCEPLDQDCTYDWVECEGNTSISGYIDPDLVLESQYLTVGLVASSAVNVCTYSPYVNDTNGTNGTNWNDGNAYQIWARVTVSCWDEMDFNGSSDIFPGAHGVYYNKELSDFTNDGWTLCYNEYYSDSTGMDSLESDCKGYLDNVVWFVGAIETSVSSTDIYMGAYVIAADLIADNTAYQSRIATLYQWGVYWYHSPSSSMGYTESSTVYLFSCDTETGLDNTRLCWHLSGVGGYRAGSNTGLNFDSSNFKKIVFYKEFDNIGSGISHINSSAPSLMPSSSPTYATYVNVTADYVFNVAQDGYSSTGYFACSTSGCGVTNTWLIKGECQMATLTVSIVETDYNSQSLEYASIFVNDVYLGDCTALDGQGTHDLVLCANNFYLRDISNFIDDSLTRQFVSITIDTSDDVNCCEYNGMILSGYATIDCLGNDTAPETTSTAVGPTNSSFCGANESGYDYEFNIKLDDWPSEVSWSLADENGTIIQSGNGDGVADFAEMKEYGCLEAGCYLLSIEDSYGDGIYSNGDYGWYRVYLSGRELTLGKTTFDDNSSILYFCTNYFSQAQSNSSLVEIDVFDFDFWLAIVDGLIHTSVWANDYEFPLFLNNATKADLYLKNGCYLFYFYILNVGSLDDGYLALSINNELIFNTTNTTYGLFYSLCTGDYGSNSTSPTTGDIVEFFVSPNGIDSKTALYKCETSGCHANKTWNIYGQCTNPRMSISIVETDFNQASNEYAHIWIDGEYLGYCSNLDGQSGHDFVDCANFNQSDMRSYISEAVTFQSVKIDIRLSDSVDCCDYNGYYLYGLVTIDCGGDNDNDCNSVEFTIHLDNEPEPLRWYMSKFLNNSWNVNDTYFAGYGSDYQDYSVVKENACVEDGCYVIEIIDRFSDGLSSSGNYGYYNVTLNGNLITFNQVTFDDHDTIFYFCTQLFDYDISPYENNRVKLEIYDFSFDFAIINGTPSFPLDLEYFNNYEFLDSLSSVQNDIIYIVDGCYTFYFTEMRKDSEWGYFNMWLNGESIFSASNNDSYTYTIYKCIGNEANTTMPATTSDQSYDYYFNVGENGEYSNKESFGCSSAGCSVSKKWKIDGYCENPTIDVNIIETDYSSFSETASIYIDGNYFAGCDALNEDCTMDDVNCILSNDSISQYIDSNINSEQFIEVTLVVSPLVNGCPYVVNNMSYYLYGSVELICGDGYQDECKVDGNLHTANWFNLLFLESNDGIVPSVDINTFIMDNTIGVDVKVTSDYIVTSQYSFLKSYYESIYEFTDHDGNLPITYLLTFEEFTDFEVRQLDNPGTCDNRLGESYSKFNTSYDYLYNYWTFSTFPFVRSWNGNESGYMYLGNDDYMEYPDGNVWDILFEEANDTDKECGQVVWESTFTLADMLNLNNDGCMNSNGETTFTFIDDSDNGIYSLQATLYLYLVSPDPLLFENYQLKSIDEMQTNYLYHALITYPISIEFDKMDAYSSVNDGIDIENLQMLGNTIYGTSYNEETLIVTLDILTWCPEYMVYILESGYYGFQWLYSMPDGISVTVSDIEDVYGNGNCFAVSHGRCFQKFRISLQLSECDEDNGGVSLNNHYVLWLTSEPANKTDENDINSWKELIDVDSVNDTLILFFDVLYFEYYESCKSYSYELDFYHNITFYNDDTFSESSQITENNGLTVFNSDNGQRIYVNIEIWNDAANDLVSESSNILDMTIVDVWFCVYSHNSSGLSDSCFDNGGNNIDIWYIYSSMKNGSSADGEYMTSNDIIMDGNNNLKEQFSFEIPFISKTESDMFGVQIGIELTVNDNDNNETRRMMTRMRMRSLMSSNSNNYGYSRIEQTLGTSGMTISISDNDNDGGDAGISSSNIFGKNAVFYYIIIGIGALLIISILTIIYLLYSKKQNNETVLSNHGQSINLSKSGGAQAADDTLSAKEIELANAIDKSGILDLTQQFHKEKENDGTIYQDDA